MIRSMTGFGRGEYSDGKRNVLVEIKSVNHRYSDITVKMPRRYSFAEDAIKQEVKNVAKRGKIEVGIIVEAITEDDVEIALNTSVAKKYIENLKELKEEFGLEGEITLSYVAGLPDVMKSIPSVESEDEVTTAIINATKMALEAHTKMRETEGQKLVEDLVMRGDTVMSIVEKIEARVPKMGEEYVAKLKERISELVKNVIEVPEERILLEAAVFADKASITEEIVRLKSHVAQLKQILNSDGSVGKKLDFLIQEMNREANTIGSKANDLDITSHMLEIKSEVEKIREQVQNIE